MATTACSSVAPAKRWCLCDRGERVTRLHDVTVAFGARRGDRRGVAAPRRRRGRGERALAARPRLVEQERVLAHDAAARRRELDQHLDERLLERFGRPQDDDVAVAGPPLDGDPQPVEHRRRLEVRAPEDLGRRDARGEGRRLARAHRQHLDLRPQRLARPGLEREPAQLRGRGHGGNEDADGGEQSQCHWNMPAE